MKPLSSFTKVLFLFHWLTFIALSHSFFYLVPFSFFSLYVLELIILNDNPVQPDAEFETLSVLMEHTQDVKAVTWHPKEEVRILGSESKKERVWLSQKKHSNRRKRLTRSLLHLNDCYLSL